jgi:uncharacterized protein YbcV (DUF1398 family)
MFTLQQITEAHSQVKSWADFPRYIQDLIKIWVSEYIVYVNDGHAEYFGQNWFSISSEAKYSKLNISEIVNIDQFKSDLKNHQSWWTNYMTFIDDCAKSWIYKRIVNNKNMTCIYYDVDNNNLLEEKIPTL